MSMVETEFFAVMNTGKPGRTKLVRCWEIVIDGIPEAQQMKTVWSNVDARSMFDTLQASAQLPVCWCADPLTKG